MKLAKLVSLEELELVADSANPERWISEQQALARLTDMIRALKPPDSEVLLLYLEDINAPAIGEITGGRKDWTVPHAIDAGDSRHDSWLLPWSSSPIAVTAYFHMSACKGTARRARTTRAVSSDLEIGHRDLPQTKRQQR